MTRRFVLTSLFCLALVAGVAPAQRITNVIADKARPLPLTRCG